MNCRILNVSLISLLLLSTVSFASPCNPRDDEEILSVTDSFELGLVLQLLYPTRMPEFDFSLPAYGPRIGFPVFGNKLELQGIYGATDTFSMQLIELTYRFTIRSPYIDTYILGGGHFLHYSESGNNYEYGGPVLGCGFIFLMSLSFEVELGMKTYYHSQPMLTFGGGFRFLL